MTRGGVKERGQGTGSRNGVKEGVQRGGSRRGFKEGGDKKRRGCEDVMRGG